MSDPAPIFVAGRWRPGTGPTITSDDPADGSEVLRVAAASVDDVDEAVHGAASAMQAREWRGLLPHQRASFLQRISDGISSRAEELALLQSRDNGKPIADCRGLVASAAGTFRFFAAALETAAETVTPSRGDYLTMTVHEPIGVVGAITPWNSPIASEAQKLAPALAAGCGVVMKPSELAPAISLELARIVEDAGVPPGVVSVVPGIGADAGEALVAHPLVRKVSFTGGTATGTRIAHVAAEKLMPVCLELGGKSPTIVFFDADLDMAVAGVAFGIFGSSGQACVAGSRLFVHASIAEAFVARLVEVAQRLRIGHPRDEKTKVGPLISHAQLEKVERYVALADTEGGTVLCGGRRPTAAALAHGHYFEPTVIAGLSNKARVCQEEIFGPVLCVIEFDDEDELVEAANDTMYGLACGIWSRDYQRAWRVARRIDAGTVWINTYKMLSISTPFGGMKASGIGREKGTDGIRQYQSEKSLYWGLSDTPLPWAR